MSSRDILQVIDQELLMLPIDKMPMMSTTIGLLQRYGIKNLGDLLSITETELLALPGFGEKRIEDANRALQSLLIESHSSDQALSCGETLVPEPRAISLGLRIPNAAILMDTFSELSISCLLMNETVFVTLVKNGFDTLGKLLDSREHDLLSLKGMNTDKLLSVIGAIKELIVAAQASLAEDGPGQSELLNQESIRKPESIIGELKKGMLETTKNTAIKDVLGTRFKPLPAPLMTEKVVIDSNRPIQNLAIDQAKAKTTLLDFLAHEKTDHAQQSSWLNGYSYTTSLEFQQFASVLSLFTSDGRFGFLSTESLDHVIGQFHDCQAFDDFIAVLCNTARSSGIQIADTDALHRQITDNTHQILLDVPLEWFQALAPHPVASDLTIGQALDNKSQSFSTLYYIHQINAYLADYIHLLDQADSPDQMFVQAMYECLDKPNLATLDVIIGRFGLFGSRKKTLASLGVDLHLTRERIRQIEKKAVVFFDPLRSKRLFMWRIATLSAAIKLGGGGTAEQLNQALAYMTGYPDWYLDSLSVLRQSPELVNIDERKNAGYFVAKDLACLGCERLQGLAEILVSSKGFIDISEINSQVACQDNCSKQVPPAAVLAKILEHIYGLSSIGEIIGSRNNVQIMAASQPMNVSAQIRLAIVEAKEPITADEICRTVALRTGSNISKSQVLSYMSRSDGECLLWNSSTYIYIDYAPFPEKLIRRIANDLDDLFEERRIPILGVNGVFDIYSAELVAEGIESPQALYSELRIIANDNLTLHEYPWICSAQQIGDRTTFAKYFYSIIEQNQGFISDEYAEDLTYRAMTQIWQLDGLGEYSPYLMRANGGWYSLEAMGLDLDIVRTIIQNTAKTMHEDEIISVKKIFADNEAVLSAGGVISYDILYRAVELQKDLPLKGSRMPHLVKSDTQNRRLTIKQVIRNYIAKKGGPCTHKELIEEFVENKGLSRTALSPSFFIGDNIIEIDDFVYCSKSALDMTAVYLGQFYQAFETIINKAPGISGLFYTMDTIAQQIDQLPILEGFAMTNKLVRFILQQNPRYRLFGYKKSCIVIAEDHPGINSMEDFYVAILKNCFKGRASILDFSAFCQLYEIHTEFKHSLFKSYDSIKLTNTMIRLKDNGS
ncbi:MAG: hypothetical protein FWH40_06490 [Coriobacteriia bacterium]|nr:hypothetical protein [Coriobacteriia bacterium]